MQIKNTEFDGRRGWLLSNGKLDLVVLAGGGHIAGLFLQGRPRLNPYWKPPWKTIEPWHYRAADSKRYLVKLLATIYGHNVCLGAFGGPSPDEERAGGPGCHGEAPIVRWRMLKKQCTSGRLVFTYGCELPDARMALTRTLTMRPDTNEVQVRETVISRSRCDMPFTMCQHVSFGPPFLEPGVTVFDMSGGAAHTFPNEFSKPQRLRQNIDFTWPDGPGPRGKVDLRTMGRGRNGDFFAVRMNPRQPDAWFSTVNPRRGLLVAYVWKQADYPWTGVWEENHSRAFAPWKGRALARGMEFANAPFPLGLRGAVDMGKFQGMPTFRWLPARDRVVFDYTIMAQAVDKEVRGVTDIAKKNGNYQVRLY